MSCEYCKTKEKGKTGKKYITGKTTIALLGQPNSGKSTLFNMLTGSQQHVGNWPGKTVEQKEGYFVYEGRQYTLMDLPGTYSLSAHSEEEIVTRNYIAAGEADLVCIIADASQLERSLFMLADYIGIQKPVILLLNMMDIAAQQKKTINCAALEKKLGIPVVPITASDKKSYDPWFSSLQRIQKEKAIDKAINKTIIDDSSLMELYTGIEGDVFTKIHDLLPESGIDVYSPVWLTAKLLEMDEPVKSIIQESLDTASANQISILAEGVKNGSLLTGECKFKWIENLLEDTVVKAETQKERAGLNKFDRIAVSRRWGKPLAIGIMIFGLIFSLVVAIIPIGIATAVFPLISSLLFQGLTAIGTPPFLVAIICEPVVSAVFFACYMSFFVFGISFVFGLLEEVGYMARISYVFDGTMAKLGLQGKAIMPFLTSFGCNIGGMAGTRVMDSWGQRVATMAMAWVVPCASTWGVVALVSGLFFGGGAVWVILSLFAVAALHLFVTSRVFGRALIKENDRIGLIMELPPYHKPKWTNLFRFVLNRMGDVLKRALKIVVVVAVVFWLLSYTSSGAIEGSVLHRIGTFIEPVTMFFGLRWQMFIAFLASMMGKEASLGVLASIFGTTNASAWSFLSKAVVESGNAELSNIMLQTISRPEALAFIFAFFFGIPCLMAVAATNTESHSLKWTLRMVGYYIVVALVLAGLAYRVGLLFL
ncbi:ferrous iron transport protein B [Treponema primitia]|uniref:ferrous iron transport protein B n=1 Tax=Treponema primitia TaxID=88058 RepID=UPI00398050EF